MGKNDQDSFKNALISMRDEFISQFSVILIKDLLRSTVIESGDWRTTCDNGLSYTDAWLSVTTMM